MPCVQGALRLPSVAIRCQSSNATLLQLVCPSAPAAASATSAPCDVQMPLALSPSVRGIELAAVAVEDYNNGGPAMRTLSLSCIATPGSVSSSALDVRAASVDFEVTNIVRPIFGDADFAEAANESETRRVLVAGSCRSGTSRVRDAAHARRAASARASGLSRRAHSRGVVRVHGAKGIN